MDKSMNSEHTEPGGSSVARLQNWIFIRQNVDYPLEGWGTKNPDFTLIAHSPEDKLLDLFSHFLFKIAISDSGQKVLRDLLKGLFGMNQVGYTEGGAIMKVFIDKDGEIMKIIWLTIFLYSHGHESSANTCPDLKTYKIYAKLPDSESWIPSEGEHVLYGTTYVTYRGETVGGRHFYSKVIVADSGTINKDSLGPDSDIIIDLECIAAHAPSEKAPILHLQASALWNKANHQLKLNREGKRQQLDSPDDSKQFTTQKNFFGQVECWDEKRHA
ncbi:hypothetical protein F5146DRAFT_1004154 [Armillaria mellea]|nr:hypothetical protein F5146DRAFT_1004154 [Armillaria mellea]